jgi:hypothetical protein
VFFIGRN